MAGAPCISCRNSEGLDAPGSIIGLHAAVRRARMPCPHGVPALSGFPFGLEIQYCGSALLPSTGTSGQGERDM